MIVVRIGKTSVLVSDSTAMLIRVAIRGVDKRVAEIDRNLTEAREELHREQVQEWIKACSRLTQEEQEEILFHIATNLFTGGASWQHESWGCFASR